MSLLNNWLELRSDAFKIAVHARRPIPSRTDTIGPWLDALSFLTWLAALTNSALVYLFRPTDQCKVVGTTLQHNHHHFYKASDSPRLSIPHPSLFAQQPLCRSPASPLSPNTTNSIAMAPKPASTATASKAPAKQPVAEKATKTAKKTAAGADGEKKGGKRRKIRKETYGTYIYKGAS